MDLTDEAMYPKVHRRAERQEKQEKQLWNIKKERAMYEEVQLERLIDGLEGHDCGRVMSISGIRNGEKKAYEPNRDYHNGGARTLLQKFRL